MRFLLADKTAAEAYKILAMPDVEVTNQSDKVTQLQKLLRLEDEIKHNLGKNVTRGQPELRNEDTAYALEVEV